MAKPAVYALVDCNNFFVSCQRLFRPDLEGKPVVVLSSGDGCVVARSNEAKAVGIPMGAPAFKYRAAFETHKVVQFSGNFELYGNISKRITALLATITPRIEVYSVDESFLDISQLPIQDFTQWANMLRHEIMKHVGIPVSIGIAPSKTLAKTAAELAKQQPELAGTFSFMSLSDQEKDSILKTVPVGELWGIGRRLAPKVKAAGIATAYALARAKPAQMAQIMGVRGRQIVAELNGQSCFELDGLHANPKSILRSRTFGEDTNQAHVLESAIATLSAQASFRLRQDKLLARRVGLFTGSNRHKPGYASWTREIRLDMPTNDTGRIISLLSKELRAIFSKTRQYHRLGVFLYDFIPEGALQTDLLGFIDPAQATRSSRRMQAIDAINTKWGRSKIRYASEELSRAWRPKQTLRSPLYVSNWNELPKARIYDHA